MASFRRRRRSSRGRKGRLRKSYWVGGMFQHNEFIGNCSNTLTGGNPGFGGEVYTWWLKWPSGLRSFTNDIAYPEEIEPVDETLVRTEIVYGAQATCSQFPGNNREAYTVGLGVRVHDPGGDAHGFNSIFTTFDTSTGNYPPTALPVVDQNEDWVFRSIGTGTQGNLIWTNTAGFEREMISRAQRKLPPGSGLLGVFHIVNLNESTASDWTYQLALDWRLLIKAGAYSPGA